MYIIPNSVSSQGCSYYFTYRYNPDPVTGTTNYTGYRRNKYLVVLFPGLTRPGIWNRAHVLPHLWRTCWPLQRWGCLTNKCVYIVCFLFVYESVLKACHSYPIYFFVGNWNIQSTDTGLGSSHYSDSHSSDSYFSDTHNSDIYFSDTHNSDSHYSDTHWYSDHASRHDDPGLYHHILSNRNSKQL